MNRQNSILRVAALSFGLYWLLVVCVMVLTGCGAASAWTNGLSRLTSACKPRIALLNGDNARGQAPSSAEVFH